MECKRIWVNTIKWPELSRNIKKQCMIETLRRKLQTARDLLKSTADKDMECFAGNNWKAYSAAWQQMTGRPVKQSVLRVLAEFNWLCFIWPPIWFVYRKHWTGLLAYLIIYSIVLSTVSYYLLYWSFYLQWRLSGQALLVFHWIFALHSFPDGAIWPKQAGVFLDTQQIQLNGVPRWLSRAGSRLLTQWLCS